MRFRFVLGFSVCLVVLLGLLVAGFEGSSPSGAGVDIGILAVLFGVGSLFEFARARSEIKMKRDVASKGNAVCFGCRHRLTEDRGRCPACGEEYEALNQVMKFWAEWEPHQGMLCKTGGGTDKDSVQPGRAKPALLIRLRTRFELLLIIFGFLIGGFVVGCRWYLQTAATGFPSFWHYVAALFALFPALNLCRSFAERRLKRDVAGKDNAACFDCGYWLTEPHGRCPECGWAYESLEDVVRFWSEWQPFRRFPRLRKQKAVEAEGSGDLGSSKEASAPE